MKTYYAKYIMPDSDGADMNGTLLLRRETPVTPEKVQRKVAKTYGIAAASVRVQSIEISAESAAKGGTP